MKRASQAWFIVAAVVWMALIFYLSSLPDLTSTLPSIWDTFFRKIAHMVEYAVLTWLYYGAFRTSRRASYSAIFCSLLYALSDEWHQSFVEGRTGTVVDVGIDTIGALTSYYLIVRSRSPKSISTPH